MRRSATLLITLTIACSQPLYDATEPGTEVESWKDGDDDHADDDAFGPTTVKTSSGVVLRVEGNRAATNGKLLPTRVVVTLEDNPVGAEVSVNCRPPTHFDGAPRERLTALCMVAELTGTETFLGSKESATNTSTLRVEGDGSVSLE